MYYSIKGKTEAMWPWQVLENPFPNVNCFFVQWSQQESLHAGRSTSGWSMKIDIATAEPMWAAIAGQNGDFSNINQWLWQFQKLWMLMFALRWLFNFFGGDRRLSAFYSGAICVVVLHKQKLTHQTFPDSWRNMNWSASTKVCMFLAENLCS